MSFLISFGILFALILAGIFGFKSLPKDEAKGLGEIDSLEKLIAKRKKTDYKLPIFFFSLFASVFFVMWVFDARYQKLVENKGFQQVIEEVDSILAVTILPPPPPQIEVEPTPEVAKPENPEVKEIVEVKKEPEKEKEVEKEIETPTSLVPPGPPGPPQKAQTIDNNIYMSDELSSPPRYVGGEQAKVDFLSAKLFGLKPPPSYRLNNRALTFTVYLVIEKDGKVSEVNIPRKFETQLDSKTIQRIIDSFNAMPNWEPGKDIDQPRRVRLAQPITLQP